MTSHCFARPLRVVSWNKFAFFIDQKELYGINFLSLLTQITCFYCTPNLQIISESIITPGLCFMVYSWTKHIHIYFMVSVCHSPQAHFVADELQPMSPYH